MSTTETFRRDDIQLLRALAVVAVVVFHGGPWMPNGYLGVDVFFAISGYVITSSVQRRVVKQGTFSIGDFLSRRVKRLLPASVTMITATVLLSLLFESWIDEQWRTQSTAFFSLFSISNIWFLVDRIDYFSLSNDKNLFLHTWSLSVEEQFYLFFAIGGAVVVRLRHRIHLRRTHVTALVALVTILSFVVYMIALQRVMERPDSLGLKDMTKALIHPFYGPVSRSWEFGAGVLVALLPSRLRVRPIWSLVGFLSIVVLISLSNNFVQEPGILNLLVIVATCFILLAKPNSNGDVNTWVMSKLGRVGVAIGDRSYSIYLWHWPILVIVNRFPNFTHVQAFVVSLVFVTIASESSFRFVERPILDSQKTFRGLSILLASWSSALIIITASVVLVTPALKNLSGIKNGFVNKGCNPWMSICVEGDPGRGAILLIGDSHAMSIKEAVLNRAEAMKLGLVVCVREFLDESDPRTLVNQFPIRSVVVGWAFNSWSSTRVKYLEKLSLHVDPKRFVITYDNPRFPDWFAPSLIGPKAKDVTHSDVLKEQSESRELINTWVLQNGSQTVDLLDGVCERGLCPVRLGGDYLYIDDNHLSLYGVGLVSKLIGDAIGKSLVIDSAT